MNENSSGRPTADDGPQTTESVAHSVAVADVRIVMWTLCTYSSSKVNREHVCESSRDIQPVSFTTSLGMSLVKTSTARARGEATLR